MPRPKLTLFGMGRGVRKVAAAAVAAIVATTVALVATPGFHLAVLCFNLWAAIRAGSPVSFVAAVCVAALATAQWAGAIDIASAMAARIVEDEKLARKRKKRARKYWE